jgi:tetratricopeptide (TPR) repeat protein
MGYAAQVHLENLVLPLRLLPKYIWITDDGPLPFPWTGLALLVAVGGLLLLAALHPKTRSGPVGAGALWIALSYAPASGIIPLSRQAADTYLYLPWMGAAWCLAALLSSWLQERPALRRPALVAAVALALAVAPLRWATTSHWEDGVALWSETASVYPDSPEVCRALGNAQTFGRRRELGAQSLQRAVQVYEHCLKALGHPELYQNNLGVTHFHLGQLSASRFYFEAVLARDPSNARAQRYLRMIKQRTAPRSP